MRALLTRARARALLASLILSIGATACTMQFRDAVQGKAVEQKISETIIPLLHSYDPSLKIDLPKCEPIIVQFSGTMGTCDLTVNGVPLKIRVAGAGPPDHFKVDLGNASFFEMAKVEKLAQNILAQSVGIRAIVSCGDPRIRLLQSGTYLTCSVSDSPRLKSIKMKTVEDGIFTYNPPGLKKISPLPQALLTLHKQGKTSIARGSDIEAFISGAIAANPLTQDHNVDVRCPTSMDLTDGKRGVCVVRAPVLTSVQRISVWIEDAVGLRARPIDAIIDRQRVQELAQSDLNRRLRDNGDAADAVVKCEKGMLVIQWPGTFDCRATVDGKRYKLVVSVQDAKGTVSWRGVPER